MRPIKAKLFAAINLTQGLEKWIKKIRRKKKKEKEVKERSKMNRLRGEPISKQNYRQKKNTDTILCREATEKLAGKKLRKICMLQDRQTCYIRTYISKDCKSTLLYIHVDNFINLEKKCFYIQF